METVVTIVLAALLGAGIIYAAKLAVDLMSIHDEDDEDEKEK